MPPVVDAVLEAPPLAVSPVVLDAVFDVVVLPPAPPELDTPGPFVAPEVAELPGPASLPQEARADSSIDSNASRAGEMATVVAEVSMDFGRA